MDTAQPTPEQVAEALHLSSDTVFIDRVAGYDIVETWDRERSGTRFYRFRIDPTGDEILVKTDLGWTSSDPKELFDAQKGLAEVVGRAQIELAGVVDPIGWVDSPPLLVLPFVQGTDLVTLLRQPGRSEWKSMEGWMRAAGAMVSAFHLGHPPKKTVDPTSTLEELRTSADRMRIDRDVVDRLLGEVNLQQASFGSFGDFGPGNLIGGDDGDVYLIDPPRRPEVAPFHRDLGNFLFEMRRQLAGHGYTRTKPVKGPFPELRDALLAGYLQQSGRPRFSAGDRGLIALYEMRRAAGLARKRLPWRPGDVAWFAGSALARRRQVKRLALQSE